MNKNGSITQWHVNGKTDQGKPTKILVSRPVPGAVKIISLDPVIHIEDEELRKLVRVLFPAQGKHGRETE